MLLIFWHFKEKFKKSSFFVTLLILQFYSSSFILSPFWPPQFPISDSDTISVSLSRTTIKTFENVSRLFYLATKNNPDEAGGGDIKFP